MSFCGAKRLHGLRHRANMSGRRAATSAKNAHAERGRFAREKRKIFRGGFWINDAVAFALGKTGVGHAADTNIIDRGKLREDGQKGLRAQRAIRTDQLYVLASQLRGCIGGPDVAVSSAFFRIRELRHDWQSGKRANCVNRQEQFFDVRKSFQNIEIHAALFQRKSLFVKNVLDLFWLSMPRLHAESHWTDGHGNQDFTRGGFARFAGDFHAPAVESLHFFGKTERGKLEAVRTKRISFNDVRARFDVGLVDAKYR